MGSIGRFLAANLCARLPVTLHRPRYAAAGFIPALRDAERRSLSVRQRAGRNIS